MRNSFASSAGEPFGPKWTMTSTGPDTELPSFALSVAAPAQLRERELHGSTAFPL